MKNFNRKRAAVLLASIALLLAAAVGGTLAYLADQTTSLVNVFKPTEVETEIVEKFDGNVKRVVQIRNNGSVAAYIRAKVIITWQNSDGDVYTRLPEEDKDYTIGWGPQYSMYWTDFEVNKTTYYQLPVSPGDVTGILIAECKPVENTAPEGYNLHVEVITQAIQAVPVEAVQNAWKVKTEVIEFDGKEYVAIVKP